MKTEPTYCPDCGNLLPEDAPKGLCPRCLLQPASLDDSQVTVRDETPSVGSNSGKRQKNLAAMKNFGDFELLEEIAHGGMGIVYKARQVSLNRIVAIKMILSGQLATENEIQRFLAEAETAANLQHPNIVAIHEVGEHQGQHYFSMDYVEGKDLSHVVGKSPLPVAEAAKFVKTIAEAIQYAHDNGIYHRDLKPQNVLIDRDGQPRITDFGLAKRLGQDESLTVTGAVIGSPQYMSPEQARGSKDQVGPRSDIYSLGGLLYFLLTASPPIRGSSTIDILKQVIDGVPDSLRKLNAKVPQDIETICLKCMEKQPEMRYGSAQEVADELGRFLNYEPVKAIPVSAVRKSWSWSQRNPWRFTAGITGFLVVVLCVLFGLLERVKYLQWRMDNIGETFVPSRWIVVTFFKVLPLFCLLIYVAGKAFRRDFMKKQDQGLLLPAGNLILHAGVGGLSAFTGIIVLLFLIRSWVWFGIRELFVMEMVGLGCICWLIWQGVFMYWEAMGAHESSFFGHVVDKNIRRQIREKGTQWSRTELLALSASLWVSCIFISTFDFATLAEHVNHLAGVGISCLASVTFMLYIYRTIVQEGYRGWPQLLPLGLLAILIYLLWIKLKPDLFTDMMLGAALGGFLSIGVFRYNRRRKG